MFGLVSCFTSCLTCTSTPTCSIELVYFCLSISVWRVIIAWYKNLEAVWQLSLLESSEISKIDTEPDVHHKYATSCLIRRWDHGCMHDNPWFTALLTRIIRTLLRWIGKSASNVKGDIRIWKKKVNSDMRINCMIKVSGYMNPYLLMNVNNIEMMRIYIYVWNLHT